MTRKRKGYDKIKHAGAGLLVAFAALFGFSVFEFPKGLVLSMVILLPALAGVLKEVYDVKKGGKFDWYDLLATVLGGCVLFVPALLVYLFTL